MRKSEPGKDSSIVVPSWEHSQCGQSIRGSGTDNRESQISISPCRLCSGI